MKRSIALTLVLAAPVALAQPGALSVQDAQRTLDTFTAAVNAGDLDAAVDTFTPDATVRDLNPPQGTDPAGRFNGRDAIRGWLATFDAQPNFALQVQVSGTDGPRANFTWKATSDTLREMGLEALSGTGTSILNENRIQTYRAGLDVTSAAKLQVTLARYAPAQPTTAEQNKLIVRRLYDEAFNRGDFTRMNEYVDPLYVTHNPTGNPGILALQDTVTALRTGFPDWHSKIELIVAEGDTVMVYQTVHGTHTGNLFGLPASNRRISLPVVDIFRIQNGRIAEHRDVYDATGLYNQLSAK